MKQLFLRLIIVLAVLLPKQLWAQEPYAALSADSLTVTFYYDDQKVARGGMDINNSDIEYMFLGCGSLVGGRGTTYNASHTDYTYARIDGGPNSETPGYFTDKNAAVVGELEPYAMLSDSNTVLTFYYDDQKESRGGMSATGPFEETDTYECNTPWYAYRESINKVVFDASFADCSTFTSTACWFYRMYNLTTVSGWENLRTDSVTDMSFMFYHCASLATLDVSNLNTENVLNMQFMFCGCSTLTKINLSSFNTSNVTQMDRMISLCENLTSIDVSSFNTSRVVSAAYMFSDNPNLTTIFADNTGWTMVGVSEHNGRNMFLNSNNLVGGRGTTYDDSHTDHTYARIDGGPNSETPGYFTDKNAPVVGESEPYAVLSGDTISGVTVTFYYDDQKAARGGMDINNKYIDTYQGETSPYGTATTAVIDTSFAEYRPTSTACWFMACSSLASINGIENIKTDNVTDMGSMFDRCSSLTSLDVSGFNTQNVTYMSYMFWGCSGLTSLDVSGFNTQNVTSMSDMFSGCSSLTSLDLSGFNTQNVTDMSFLFFSCSGLTSLDVSNFNTQNVTNMSYMFYGCSALTSLDLSGFNTQNVTDMGNMFRYCSALTSLDLSGFNTQNVTYMSFMFLGCSGLTSLDLSGFNTQNVTNMDGMFWGCSGLTSLDVTGFDTQNVTQMYGMFQGCSSLTSLDLSNFNTQNVTEMNGMFSGCSGLTSLDFSGFDTQNVTNMSYMFYGCSALTSLDLSGFNTQNVTDMGNMFRYCSALTSLDLSGFNTQNVTYMYDMFRGCSGLTSLDVSGFDTQNVTDMRYMFHGCSSLTTIYAGSEWNTNNVTDGSDMFNGCTSLVGGAGTVFDENHTDQTYARIDGGPDSATPGYFTAKSAPDGEATFDGLVATVSGGRTLDEAFEEAGGRSEASKTLAAIVWNKETALTAEDLQGLTNPNLLVFVQSEALAPEGRNNIVVDGVCEHLVLTDVTAGNGNFFAPQAFTAQHAEYTHTYTQETPVGGSQGWETLTLPFTVQTVTHVTQGEIAPFAAMNDEDDTRKPFWLYTTGAAGGIGFERAARVEAYRPYLIAMPNNSRYREEYRLNGEVTFAAENAEVQATTLPSAATGQHYTFMPTTLRVAAADSVYALNTQGEGGYLTGSLFVRNSRDVLPFECYVTAGQVLGAPRLLPVKDMMDATTDITDIMLRQSATAADGLYDLGGRKVRQAAKGAIHVQHGRKAMQKGGRLPVQK